MASLAAPARAALPPAPAPDVAALPARNPRLLIIGVMLASILQVLDTTIANVAVPHMQASLGATTDTISWVLTSYIVASAVAMPITGWLAERIGSRRLFIGSVAFFIGASALCGAAQNLPSMVLFRAIQGVAGAFISPLSQSVMIDTTPPSRQPQVMSIWAMGIMVGPIMGPVLGGWLTEEWSWRWVFYVNVPLGVVSLALMIAELPSRPLTQRRFDLIGFTMLGLLLASLQLLLDRGNSQDWFDSVEIWVYACIAVSAAWAATIHFATAEHPLFHRQLFADRNFIVASLISVVVGLVMMATIALLPPMLEHLFGYTVIDTGFSLAPRGIGTILTMQLAGNLTRRGFDTRVLVGGGFAIAALSLWMMSGWTLEVDYWTIVSANLVQGIGMGLVFIPINITAFSTLTPELRTEGASVVNLFRSVGSSVGISVVTTLFARNLQTSHSDLSGHLTATSFDLVDFSTVDRLQSVGDAAAQMVDGFVNQQAAMIAYLDDFYAMMWASLAVIPLALLLRPVIRR